MEYIMARHSIWRDCSTRLPWFHHRYKNAFSLSLSISSSLSLSQRKLQENVLILLVGFGHVPQTVAKATGSTISCSLMYVYQYDVYQYDVYQYDVYQYDVYQYDVCVCIDVLNYSRSTCT